MSFTVVLFATVALRAQCAATKLCKYMQIKKTSTSIQQHVFCTEKKKKNTVKIIRKSVNGGAHSPNAVKMNVVYVCFNVPIA